MSTITLKIDTEHLDQIALDDIQTILRRVGSAAANENAGFLPIYPYEIFMEEALGGNHGNVARFGFDKNKPRL